MKRMFVTASDAATVKPLEDYRNLIVAATKNSAPVYKPMILTHSQHPHRPCVRQHYADTREDRP